VDANPTLDLCLQAIVVIISIPTTHSKSTSLAQDKKKTITYRKHLKTPNHNICLQSLKAKANDGLNKIHQLKRLGNGVKKALNSCGEKYRAILVPVIPQAN
jgi:curli biogenesis system outer membrane secretion channel CsgG